MTPTPRYKVILTFPHETEEDIRLLPFWLDYHILLTKHIFSSGIVFGLNGREDVKQTILRFFPDWEFSESYADSICSNDDTIFFPMSISEFLVDSSPLNGFSVRNSYFVSPERIHNGSGVGGVVRRTVGLVCESSANAESLESVEIAPTLYKNTMQKYSAYVDIKSAPNNVVDFFSNIYERRDSSEAQTELTFLLETPLTVSILRKIEDIKNRLKTTNYIYYLDAYIHQNVDWGEDRVILAEDTNLLERTKFNAEGHAIFPMESHNTFLRQMVATKIEEVTSRHIDIEKYHQHINDEEHTRIINAMPWKKTESPEIREFAEYMETRVSEILERRVKIFNDDIWVRICRPSSVTDTDYNPCHRDIYLDFYRNIANIYVPIVGSNARSSLAMQSGSHLWNERDIVVTRGGAFFPNSGKKYSVDAVLRSRQPLQMIRPNPREEEFILFSPYLIHGCSSNENTDATRMSVEIRFIEDTEGGRKQEAEFRDFLGKRVWR